MQKSHWLLLWLCLGICASPLASVADESVSPPLDTVLIGSDDIEVTVEEVMLYLEWLSIQAGVAVTDLTGQRVSQAVIELYALEIVDIDAAGTSLYSPALAAWLPEHLLTMNRVKRFIDVSVENAMLATDWESEAREFYTANLDEFVVPDTITLRTLLLTVESRSMDEALEMAETILASITPEHSFESMVVQYSEDEAGRAANGLMENVTRGQTVPSFEEAAFSLSEPGEVSDPVVSEFGVHLIELVSKSPARQSAFEEVSADIVFYLRRVREGEYREAIQNEARSREPAGYKINESAIDAFMSSLGHTRLNARQLSTVNE